jgi:hypothetical protein
MSNPDHQEVTRRPSGRLRRFTSWLRELPRRPRAALTGYLIVVLFGLGFGVATMLRADRVTALVAGVLLAGPIIVALVGDRITGVKAFSIIELSLSDVAVPVESDFAGTVMSVLLEMQGSAAPDLFGTLRSVIDGRSRVLRVNLRDERYWWSTRIFLLGALASDYTNVEALVFVRGGGQQLFIGLASPRAVRDRLASRFPDYEANYRKVRAEIAQAPMLSPDQELDAILTSRWSESFSPSEEDARVLPTAQDVREWLGEALDDEPLPYGPLSPLLRYRIAVKAHRFAALVDGERLVAVVDRDELVRRIAVADLEQRFS